MQREYCYCPAPQNPWIFGPAYTRILRIARTLADLDGHDGLKRRHIPEAVSFRRRKPGAVNNTPAEKHQRNAAF
ncbi:MAG: hypothetical protein HKP25_09905 [Marinicaulis sp.]|nr:hypothetical protein [Marinicaulis sp.]